MISKSFENANKLDSINVVVNNVSTFNTSVSAPALSGTFYGDGSRLTGIVGSGGTANALPLSGGTVAGNLIVQNNLTVQGNLTALGTTTFVNNTTFTTTSAFSITNVSPVSGSSALYVGQSGPADIASFFDIDRGIEVLHVGGANSIFPGVGVRTSNPNKTFSVAGEISASQDIWTGGSFRGDGSKLTGVSVSDKLPLSGGTLTGNVSLVGTAIQIGQNIDGEAVQDLSGYSVSVNEAGDVVAIGAIANDVGGTRTDAGHVRVYSLSATSNGTAWTQLGSDIDGEGTLDFFGVSVSLNNAGNIVAIGGMYNDVGGTRTDAGHVRVYSLSATSTGTAWTQLGLDLDGEGTLDYSGQSVSMNGAGTKVAIGAPGNLSNKGHVRVYSWTGTAWSKSGFDIDGEAAGDSSGCAVSMNEAGDVVAIGATQNDGNGSGSGHVRVYYWDGAAWFRLGSDIDGEAANDNSGYSVSLNAAGDRVAIGAIYNDTGGGPRGHVRVYTWNGTVWTQLGSDIDGEGVGDTFGNSVSMNKAGDRIAIGAPFNSGNGNLSGHVRIYHWNGSGWNKLLQDIDGPVNSSVGSSVSMNGAGDIVAIGATGPGSNRGAVYIYSIPPALDVYGDIRTSGKFYGDGSSLTGVVTDNSTLLSLSGGTVTGDVTLSLFQLGQDIDGEAALDQSGVSVSMNDAGDRVAIGSIANDVGGTKTNAGNVRVYSLSGSSWIQLGLDIDGEAAADSSGVSVSMNGVGNRVAIGAAGNDANGNLSGHVRVYSLSATSSGTAWTQLGLDIDGEAAEDYFGISVSMNYAGDIVAIGGMYNDAGGARLDTGHVRVYSLSATSNGTAWTQLGLDIDGEGVEDFFGTSVSMNSAGNIVAIGATANNGNGTDRGHVRVFSLSATSSGTAWTQLGLDIDGEANYDYSGQSVSMNSAGDRVVIGATWNRGNRGHARIYSWNGTAWTQLGADIDGDTTLDQSGFSVSINNAGDRVAIGAPYASDPFAKRAESGRVRLYYWDGSAWTQLGYDIYSEAQGDRVGYAVSMNGTGDRVAIGATYNDGNGAGSGHVRVYTVPVLKVHGDIRASGKLYGDGSGLINVKSSGVIVDPTSITSTLTSYIFKAADANEVILCNNTSPLTASVPANTFTVGTEIVLIQRGGVVTLSAGPGVTIESNGNKYKTNGTSAGVCLINIQPNVWFLGGSTAI
jgi:hypothetical protein